MMIMNYDNVANRWEKRSLGLGREERTAMQASDLLVSSAKSSSTKFNSKSSSSLSNFESSSSKSELPKSKASTMLLAHPGNAHPSVRVPHPLEAIFVLIVIVK